MAFLQWRRFNFFEKDLAKDPDTSQPLDILKDLEIICVTSGRGLVVFGDQTGHLHLVSRQLKISSFPAFELKVSHVLQMQQNPILVAVGEDESGPHPVIKLWNIEKTDPVGKPHCIRIMRSSLNVASPVTSLAIHENLNFLAIGFYDSSVILIRGDITRERQSKPKLLNIGKGVPITGLAFRTMGKVTLLFVVTNDEIYCVSLLSKDKETFLLLDSHGCPEKCSIMSDAKQDNQFVIGRSDAVYFYQHDGRGPCFAFEGEKVILHWFKSYLVVVGRDNKPMQPTATNIPSIEMNVVTIYDIPNKFIAYSAPFPAVVDIVSEWGTLYVLCRDGKLFNLLEKDTQSKLDMLFKKNQYSLAISLAKSQQYDEDGLIDIFRQYGDHLYTKGDHDGAISQYKKTIGKLEASYVIRKFLDAQRIHNLTDYLQSLHKKGLATEDHTTLLLNCYTKLKDIGKLDEFIMTEDREVDFDVEIAMKVCRQAGYYKHALSVAEKHKQHDWYLKIQIEDLKQYEKALNYISKLEFYEAEKNMKKYGKILMSQVPEQTTTVLKHLCTNNSSGSDLLHAAPEDFVHIFDNNSERLTEFFEHMRKVQSTSSNLMYNTLLELYLQSCNHSDDESIKKTTELKILELLKLSDTRYNIDQALVLCEINNFKPGILHLYEKAKLYQQILFYHMENNDYDNILRTCSRYGTNDPNLWVQALWYFCKLDQNQKPYIVEVLKEIEVNNLLSPILVVEIMSKSHIASLDLIKDYICRYLQKENEQISEDERLIKQYKEETEKMRHQIEELKTSAKIFQVSKCSGCNHQLELPSVHFLCNHSYHQQCFESYSAENDSECPLCLPENRKVMNIIQAQEMQRDLHEQFHHQLERSEDGFSIVADYFGRGVFNKVTLVVDSSKATNVSHL